MEEDIRWFPNPNCHKPHALWSAPDKMATEYEITALVRALVEATKPELVVETGSYLGYTSMAIAESLHKNGVGRLITFEIDPETAIAAEHTLEGYNNVEVIRGSVQPVHIPGPVEFAWIDSGMRTRQTDINIIWPKMAPGGLALVHDASPERPPGLVRPQKPFSLLSLGTPRGLNIFQKPWE